MDPSVFQQNLLTWFDRHGRKNLPWQKERSPYRVWISETMLQQTQVSTVIPYFNRFVEKFPDIDALAESNIDDVLTFWSGLGYYARARNLHKTAGLIVKQGYFPQNFEVLCGLPGIGRSTAGAILSIAFNKSAPILDGNVKRVLARFKGVHGWPGEAKVNSELWRLSSLLTPVSRVAEYTQAIMDLGATICTRHNPACLLCPFHDVCVARLTGKVQEIPGRKPVKILPVKQLIFLIISDNDNRILLEKRPQAGIWGGLWSFPEFDDIDSALCWCGQNDIKVISQKALKNRRHSFSHYHLDFTPLRVKTDYPNNKIMEAHQSVWYKIEQMEAIGLPTPIKLLLQQT